jgi:hypothetical protein
MLLPLADVKARFPRWKAFCQMQQTEPDADVEARLQQAARHAEGELQDYVAVTGPADMTERLERYLLDIIRFNAHEIKHSSEDYDTKPAVVRRYERTLDTLAAIRNGTQPDPRDLSADDDTEDAPDVHVQAKPRRFDRWFTT